MGDQLEDQYSNVSSGVESPANWVDAAPAAPIAETTPASSSSYPPVFEPAAASSFETPASSEVASGDGYGATGGFSGWSDVSESGRGATSAAVLDEPWTPSPLAPAAPIYDAPTSPNLAKTPVRERPRSVLAEPFPRAWTLGVMGGVALALIVAFLVQALIMRGDWAEGALVAGYTAFGLAVFALFVVGLRYALGRRATIFYALAGLLLAVLLGTGGGSLALAHQLRLIQARSFENARQWDQAAREYALYGERAPHAPNLQRVYLHWGQDLAQKQAWSDAATHLSAALAANPGDTDLAAQVNSALYTTFAGWMRSDVADVPYSAAIESFKTERGAASCDATCQTDSAALEAQARYLYGQQLSTDHRYADAAAQFSAVEAQLGASSYAAQSHTAAATAYLALGQEQIAGPICTDAVPTYQTLAKSYSDTPEGKQAIGALAAPQKVTGKFTGQPTGSPVPRVRLSTFANPASFVFSNDYATSLDTATGVFAFAAVKPGAYNLSTARDLGYKVNFTYYPSNSGDLYWIKVGPLCTLNLPSIPF